MSKPPISDDGRFWWDGERWQSLYSPDGRLRWDGRQWQPAGDPAEAAVAASAPAPIAIEDDRPLEPSRPLGGGLDWSQEVAPRRPVAGGIDWSRGVAGADGDLPLTSGSVVDRPHWLHPGERYNEGLLAGPAPVGRELEVPAAPTLAPWQQVAGPQKSRIIPMVAAGAFVILAMAWVATSAGVTLSGPDLPFLSRQDSSVAAATPRPRPPAVSGHHASAAERYAVVMNSDGGRLNAALAGVTDGCRPEAAADQCRPAAQAALAAVGAYRHDLADFPVPPCLRSVNVELMMGLDLYDQGLSQMVGADPKHPEQLAAAAQTFDAGSQHMIVVNRLMDSIDPSSCR